MERRDHDLHYLFLEITRGCNLRCRHCGSDCGAAPVARELSLADWVRVLEGVVARFSPPPAIVVTGGEPLAAPLFVPLARAIGKLGLRWGFVSNGLLLDRATLDDLAGTGLGSITLSVDGPREVHEWVRGGGTRDAAMRAARAVREVGGIHLDIVTCVPPRLLPRLDAFAAEMLALSPDSWRLFRIFPKGRAKGDRELLLDLAGHRAMLEWIAANRPRFRRAGVRLEASCDSWMPFGLDARTRSAPFFCRSGVNIASVLADGSVNGCSNNDPSLAQGNVLRDDFPRVWEAGFRFFREPSSRKTGACAACDHFPRCEGGSLHSWRKGSPSPDFCWENDGLSGRGDCGSLLL